MFRTPSPWSRWGQQWGNRGAWRFACKVQMHPTFGRSYLKDPLMGMTGWRTIDSSLDGAQGGGDRLCSMWDGMDRSTMIQILQKTRLCFDPSKSEVPYEDVCTIRKDVAQNARSSSTIQWSHLLSTLISHRHRDQAYPSTPHVCGLPD